MSDPQLPLARFPDNAWHGRVEVVENVSLARKTLRVRIESPELAQRIVPGQFVMLRLAGRNDPLLGRPLALYDVVLDADGGPRWVDIVYLEVGRMTGRLATLRPGDPLEMWGPLGNGFPPQPAEHLLMVAGGIGQTPMLALAKEHLGRQRYGDPPRQVPRVPRVTLCYGARSAEYLAGVEDFDAAGIETRLATEDGSRGHAGRVTELIASAVGPAADGCRIVCCGPEPMMAATRAEARRLGIPCQVSLETPMACGVGICFSCVAKIRDDAGGWDYRRTCVEGPVFDADRVVFDDEEDLGAPAAP